LLEVIFNVQRLAIATEDGQRLGDNCREYLGCQNRE